MLCVLVLSIEDSRSLLLFRIAIVHFVIRGCCGSGLADVPRVGDQIV